MFFCALVKRVKGLLYLLLNSEIMIALLAIFAFSVLETYRLRNKTSLEENTLWTGVCLWQQILEILTDVIPQPAPYKPQPNKNQKIEVCILNLI